MFRSVLILALIHLIFSCGRSQDRYESLRKDMVEKQIRARGVTDQLTLHALLNVERHLFVPENLIPYAYDDRPLPIGEGQTISQPYIVGFMTSAINPQKNDKILEVGTGSGYQAAVLSRIVSQVYTIEIIPELAERAQVIFKELGYDNIFTRIGDGYHGWPEEAPFDAIIVTAAAENIPPALIEQLKIGGKLIIPVGPASKVQSLQLITRGDKKNKAQILFPVRFVPFTREGDH